MQKPEPTRSRGVRWRRGVELPAPRGLTVGTFSVDSDEYAVLSFPLPEVSIPPELTPAEQEVVRKMLDGNTNAEIARARKTSSNTVANQLQSVYAKLRVSGRSELVQRCAAHDETPVKRR